MRPFVHAFHEMCGGTVAESNQWRRVSGRARFAVEIWRVCSILLFIDKEYMSVALRVMIGSPLHFEKLKFLSNASYMGVAGSLALGRSK